MSIVGTAIKIPLPPVEAVETSNVVPIAAAPPAGFEEFFTQDAAPADAGPAAQAPAPAPALADVAPAPAPFAVSGPGNPVAPFSVSAAAFLDQMSAAPTPTPSAADPAMVARIAALEAQIATANARAAAPVAAPSRAPMSFEPTEEESATYGASRGYIEKLIGANMQGVLDRIDAMAQTVDSRVSAINESVSGFRTTSYRQQLYAAEPNVDAIIADPNFNSFLSQQIPFTNETVKSRLTQAHQNNDLGGVLAVIRGFQQVTAGNTPAGASAAPTNAQQPLPFSGFMAPMATAAAPAMTPLATHTIPVGSKPILKLSKLREANKLEMEKQMSKRDYEVIREQYDVAYKEGRVDPNS